MANTTLFAPQVRSVQPAFELKENNVGEVYIHFSLSDFNQNVNIAEAEYKIIDPNVSAGWGDNSMIKDASKIYSTSSYNTIYLNETEFKPFTINQYYQVQMRFKTVEQDVSPWSQVTLIRPIPEINDISIVQKGNMLNLNRVEGNISYVDGSTVEAIKSYFVVVKNAEKEVYRSDLINNTLGTSFATNLYNCFLDDGDYTLYVEYTTINGYSNASKIQNGEEQGNDIHIGLGSDIESAVFPLNGLKIENDLSSGAINIEFNTFLNGCTKCSVQRADEDNLFSNWNEIKTFPIMTGEKYKIKDYIVHAETVYKYRFVFSDGTKTYLVSTYIDDNNDEQDIEALAKIEGICLLDEHEQLFIRYNPNISGFKYVTQESLTNTLGGRYPFVRINGDTKYRQFNLSGTITFKMDYLSLNRKGGYDSCYNPMNQWIKDDSSSMLFDAESLFNNFTPDALALAKNSISYVERKLRKIATDFLTNQKPKLFRGMGEDTMIVYLSGVSFTPNKQLGREIWDFSCTVTEICEFNQENLIKFKVQKNPVDMEMLGHIIFFLNMQQQKILDTNGDVLEIIDYISLDDTINNLPVLIPEWRKA